MSFQYWLRRFSQPNTVSPVSNRWTDNLSVTMRSGRTVEDLVDHIFLANKEGRQHQVLITELPQEFGLTPEDAEVAVDRVCAGVARALTGTRANRPDRIKDPIAWMSFQRAITKE